MFTDHLAASIAAAPLRALDDIQQKAIAAWGASEIDDDALSRIAEAIRARRKAAEPPAVVAGTFARPASLFAPRKRQRSPKCPEKIERRRTLGTSSALPPALRARFTLGEVAVLSIVIIDVRAQGYCDASVAEIGARAGCGRTLVRNALRMAETLGLLVVKERPVRGAKHKTNVITIISAELKGWIARGPGHRGQKNSPLQRESAFRKEDTAKLSFNSGDSRPGSRAMQGRNSPRHLRAKQYATL